jgi:hypothetical protein
MSKYEAGLIEYTDRESDKKLLVAATLQCVHCGGQWIPQPGSGRIRGFCTRCCGPVCGPGCAKCVPTEQYLENIEQGKPADHYPAMTGWTPAQEGSKIFVPET